MDISESGNTQNNQRFHPLRPSTMSIILWQDSYSVGVRILDEHHKHLAKLINQLSGCRLDTIHSESVVDVISDLTMYAKYHFEHEESLMERYGFPHRHNHAGEHTQFCETITDTNYLAASGLVDISQLADYLAGWWKKHILQEDMQFKPFFAGKGVM